jgi:ComF family protein
VAETFTGDDCPWCRDHDLRFDRTVTVGSYQRELRDAVLKLKHPRTEDLAAALAALLLSHEATLRALGIDAVAPIPMHWRRRVIRGHNGPELIAGHLARRLRAKYDRRLLVRRRYTQPQAGLSPPARRENVHQAFAVRWGRRLKGRRILLVDDILTTGATCSEAAKVLKKAGAATVVVAVLARAQGET